MEIDNELKVNLIADVENVCNIFLTDETKETLKRCFEVTIGTHIKELNLSKNINAEMFLKEEIKKDFNTRQLVIGLDALYQEVLIGVLDKFKNTK